MRRALTAALVVAAGAAQAQAPAEAELEFWRAATRLDTPASYEAYLAAFPRGLYAPLARAALDKLRPAAAPAAEPQAPLRPARLAAFGRGVNSGASELPEGARLTGPGVVTVASIGTRKQLVLPAGEWVLLAAEDHRVGSTVKFTLASFAFGRFDGSRLTSLLVATTNARAVSASGGSPSNLVQMGYLPRWTVAERCEAGTRDDLALEVQSDRWMRRCAALRPAGDWRATLAEDTPALADALAAALKTAGADVVPFATRSEWQLTDARYAWLGVMRWDAAGPVPARVAHLKAYLPLAAKGLLREFEGPDLQPGGSASSEIQLAD